MPAEGADSPIAPGAPLDTESPHRTRRLLLRVGLPLALLVAVIFGWWLWVHNTPGGLTPGPWDVAKGFWGVLQSGDAWSALAESDKSLAIGYAISVALGIPLGFLFGRSRFADRFLGPSIDIALVIPTVVVMPIVLVAVGINREAQIVIIVLFALPYVVVPIRSAVKSMPREWLEVAQVLCAKERQLWGHILLPGTRRSVATGLRLGLAHALTGLLVVEFTLVALGIGRIVLAYQTTFDFGKEFGYILLVMIQVFVFLGIIGLFERRGRE